MVSSVNNPYAAFAQPYGSSKSSRTNAAGVDFRNAFSQSISANATPDTILAELQTQYGARVSVEMLPDRQTDPRNFQRQLNDLGARTFGTNNIVIAPNMLEKMAQDPQAKEHYMNEIQNYFNSRPQAQAFMAAHGRQIVSSGVIVHEDGSVSSWSCSDYTPEEKARLDRAMKEEDEEKAKKRAEQKSVLDTARTPTLQSFPIPTQALKTQMIKGAIFHASIQ